LLSRTITSRLRIGIMTHDESMYRPHSADYHHHANCKRCEPPSPTAAALIQIRHAALKWLIPGV
jgi:hypothetical protein